MGSADPTAGATSWHTALRPIHYALGSITADKIKDLDLIDNVIEEPLGGAHRDHEQMAERLKAQLKHDLAQLTELSNDDLLDKRYQRLMSFGYC